MSYAKLAMKMFWYRCRQYRLFWTAQIFTVILFYTIYVYYTDVDFMEHYNVVSPKMSDIVNLAMIGIYAFAVCFIPFSHWLFFKNRAEDFSTLLSLGLTKKMMYQQIVVEHLLLDITAMGAGILIGTGCSYLLYEVFITIFEISPLAFPISLKGYVQVVIIVLIVDVMSLLGIMIKTVGQSIRQLSDLNQIGHQRTEHKNKVCLLVGIILFFGSNLYILVNLNRDMQLAQFIGALTGSAAGTFLVMQNIVDIRRKKRTADKNVYEYEKLYWQSKKLKYTHSFVSILLTLLVFLQASGVGSIAWNKDYDEQKHPFDLVYVNEFVGLLGQPSISSEQLESILAQADTEVLKQEQVTYYRNGTYTIFNVEDVNRVCNTNYAVENGSFLRVFRECTGYWGENLSGKFETDKVTIPYADGDQILTDAGYKTNMLFGYACMSDRVIVINAADYKKLEKQTGDYCLQELYAINFDNWKKSGSVIEKMKKILQEESYRALYSKYQSHFETVQSAWFELFFFTIISMAIYLASFALIHFQYKVELESERKEYKKLLDIGMTEKQWKYMECKKIKQDFIVPVIPGIIEGMLMSCFMAGGNRFLPVSIISVFLAGGMLILVQIKIAKWYVCFYEKLVCFTYE